MDKDKAKVIEIVGTASERAGSLVGKAAALGKRNAGVAAGGVSAGKGMLGLADEDTKPTPGKKSNSTKAVALKSDLATVRRKLAEAEKAESQLESQIETLQKKNDSLISELEQVVSKAKETTASEGAVRARVVALESKLEDMQAEKQSLLSELETARKEAKEADGITNRPNSLAEQVAALESELAATGQELTETRSQAKKAQSQLASQVKDLQTEEENLISDLEKARSETDGMASREKGMSKRAAALESDLAATRRKLEELRNQAESAQTELTSQVEKLQLEKDSLNSELWTAQSQADEAKARENAMKTKAAALESEVTVLRSELARARKSVSDNNSIQTEHKEKADIDEQTVKEIEPSTQVTAQKEQIDINVENVEEPELKPESQVQPEVAPAHSAEVTAEDAQAADFKKGAERILFTRAISDFASQDAATRADAAAAIAGIHHELSPRLIIAHMADEPSAYVRQECIKTLTALESKEGLSTIEQALADEAASVRLAAVWGLYRLTGTESIPVLTRMLSDKDTSVRRRAVTCIGWLGRQVSQADNHRSHQVISALVQCLNDPAVKNAAIDTLQIVTGKKMSVSRTSPEHLIEQWQKWWKAELLG